MTHFADPDMDFAGVTRKNLHPDTQVAVRNWRDAILEGRPDAKYGLWLFGPRFAGTSYAAQAVAADLTFNHGYTDTMQVNSLELIDEIKGSWSMSAQTRANADDVGLYWEAQMADDSLDVYFNRLDVLWLDDFHDETISMPMWKNHIQPRAESRVKQKRIVIVSTTMPPNAGTLPQKVIEGLFTPVFFSGYRP